MIDTGLVSWNSIGAVSGTIGIFLLFVCISSLVANDNNSLWAFPLAMFFCGIMLYSIPMVTVTEENYVNGYGDAQDEYNYTKLQLCTDYYNKFESSEYTEYKNESKYNYCNGYIHGYDATTDEIEVTMLENNLSM